MKVDVGDLVKFKIGDQIVRMGLVLKKDTEGFADSNCMYVLETKYAKQWIVAPREIIKVYKRK